MSRPKQPPPPCPPTSEGDVDATHVAERLVSCKHPDTSHTTYHIMCTDRRVWPDGCSDERQARAIAYEQRCATGHERCLDIVQHSLSGS
ncbi:hypothetical protein PLICRDRAFT_42693 [Plicaturopsis crispa FD-325 SS-3]|nr:hypothetical protein PLICRDRAFT_42693 [Plicaturopsis crispa FD-325 SS-3]